jgi:hypothetical protein
MRKNLALYRGTRSRVGRSTATVEHGFRAGYLAYSRPYQILTVVDNWSSLSPVLEAMFQMSGEIVS